MEETTPLVSHSAAEGVWNEAVLWLGTPLPRSWISYLADRAETIYAHNPRFRRLLGQKGNAGREWLWSFMRHWMWALIQQHRPEQHRRLPTAYSIGRELPANCDSH